MSIPAYDREPIWPDLKDNRIILLGDALHPMSPFKGQGANQALIDAIEISDLLAANKEIKDLDLFLKRIS
jgi:2-polyprenyl-6-methoxyphenol hydroxylase-like FAD-dependent oxidoreductase